MRPVSSQAATDSPTSAPGASARSCEKSAFQSLGVLSRPTDTSRPSRVKSMAATPPPCAGHAFTSVPFSGSQSRIWPSSQPVASTLESPRQARLVTAAG